MSVRDSIKKAKPTIAEYTLSTGDKVWVRAFSGAGRAAYMEYVEKAKANGGIHSEVIVAMCLCEQDGVLCYDSAKAEDLEELRQVNGQDLDGISIKLFEISGLASNAIETAEKN